MFSIQLFFSDELPQFGDPDELKVKLASKIASKTRDEWAKIFDALPDACVIPVLELDEAPYHPQNLARKSFVKNAKGNFEPVSSIVVKCLKFNKNILAKGSFRLDTAFCGFCSGPGSTQ